MDRLQGRKLKLQPCATEHNKRLREQWFEVAQMGYYEFYGWIINHAGWKSDETFDSCTLDDKGTVVMKAQVPTRYGKDGDRALYARYDGVDMIGG